MNNKLIICGLVMIFLLAGFCLAQQESSETTDTVAAGRIPGHLFYGLDRFSERVQLAFTANNIKKGELHLKFADERLAELNKVVEKNKTKYFEKLAKDEEQEIEKAQEELQKATALGQNTTLLSQHVAAMTYKHIIVLQRVLEKVPEQARDSILHAINVSQNGYANAVARIEKETGKPAGVPKIKPEETEKEKPENKTEEAEELEATGAAVGKGKLVMKITDKPATLNISQLEITISSIKVHVSGTAVEAVECVEQNYTEIECHNDTEVEENCTDIMGTHEVCTNVTGPVEVCVNETRNNQTCTEPECVNGTFVEEECVNGTLIPAECTNQSYVELVCHNETVVINTTCVNESIVVDETCTNETTVTEDCDNVTLSRDVCSNVSGGGTAGWKVVTNASKTFDLIALRNVKELLGTTELEAGKYTQIRLYISSAKLQIGGVTQSLKIPSGAIKLIHPFTISANATTTLTIDFDAEESVHQAGDKYLMKPTIKIIAG
jgi:hypothetical protein